MEENQLVLVLSNTHIIQGIKSKKYNVTFSKIMVLVLNK